MRWWQDTAERALATMLQVVLASISVEMLYRWFAWLPGDYKLVIVTGIAAGLAVIKAALARRFGDSESASLIG